MKTFNPTKSLGILAGMAALAGVPLSGTAQSLIDQWNFNEASGTTAANSVGGGVSATLMGGATFNGSGQAVLNGTTGTYINLGGGLLSGLTSATFEGWFSYSVGNDNVHLFAFDDGTGTGTYNNNAWNGKYLRYNVYASGHSGGVSWVEIPNVGNPSNQGNASDGRVDGTSVLSQNTLHQAVFVYDSANGVESIYVDGALQSTVSGTVTALSNISNTRGTLGASPWDAWGDKYLTGSIDQFSIYDGALSASQIAANFATGPTPVPEPSSLALAAGGLTLLGLLRRRNQR